MNICSHKMCTMNKHNVELFELAVFMSGRRIKKTLTVGFLICLEENLMYTKKKTIWKTSSNGFVNKLYNIYYRLFSAQISVFNCFFFLLAN